MFIEGNEIERACMGSDQEAISVVECDTFEVMNNIVHDGITEGIDAKLGCSNGTISGNVVYRQMAPGRCPPAVYIDAGSKKEYNIEVSGNICFNSGHGFCVSSEVGGQVESIRVHHNTASYNREGRGFWVVGHGQATAHPIRGVDIYDNTSFENGVGFELGGYERTTLDQIRLYNNISFKNKAQGIRITRYDGPSTDFLLKGIEITNNTVFGNGLSVENWGDGGIDIGINLGNLDAQSIIVRNNLVSNNAAFSIRVLPDVPSQAVSVDHNLIDGFRSVPYETQGTSPVIGDPAFMNALDNDFHLSISSAAIDKGSSEDVPANDFDGTSRPLGSGYDIGAFEFEE